MNVLVLEHNVKERTLIQNALGKAGHYVILNNSADQAWRLLEAGGNQIFLAFI